jgi:hypothetical protein
MIAPLSSAPGTLVPGLLAEDTRQDTGSTLNFSQLLNQNTGNTAPEPKAAAPAGAAPQESQSGLEAYLAKLTGSSKPVTVNEEQLFASILHNRIASSKGEGLAKQFDTLLTTKLTEHTRADGVVFVEDAARAVLREMAGSGQLTEAEAESFHGQAFQAAQLDDNTTALYDSLGATSSTAVTATAIEKALDMLLKFDKGELPPAKLSLSYEQSQTDATISAAGLTATSAASPATTATTATAVSGYTRSAEFTTKGVANGDRQYWRIPQSGPQFGKELKAVFADGHTVVVKNTSQRYAENDGFIFRPGIGSESDPRATDTWTSHKGAFIHAPFGNNSKTVKLYWS